MLYDGTENWFTQWMRERGVDVIFAESDLKRELWRLSKLAPSLLSLLPGVFLRLELPRLGSGLNATNPVLYTDCDVMFRRDVAIELKDAVCTYFAVAGESRPDDYRNINTGVMLMNLEKLREVDVDFRAYVRNRLEEFAGRGWDQGAYRRFFGWEREALLWDRLPPSMNWKPYWGDTGRASIIHFHGLKPREYEKPNPELLHLNCGDYQKLSREWMIALKEADESPLLSERIGASHL